MKEITEQETILRSVIPYFQNLGYFIFRQEEKFGVGARRISADVVIYAEDNKAFAVVEVKGEHIHIDHENIFDSTVQQALRYALIVETPYFIVTNGQDFFWYRVNYNTGLPNLIDPIANRSTAKQYALFHSFEEASRVLDTIDDFLLANSGSFYSKSELIKILLVKAYDEQRVEKGLPSEFYTNGKKDDMATTQRIASLYRSWSKDEDAIIHLLADHIVFVVSTLQSYSLLQSDKRYIKPALDRLIESMFKRDRGQYITPFPILEFLVELLKPLPGEYVIDPFCGTAGFLSHVLTTWHSLNVDSNQIERVYGVDISSEIAQIAKLNVVISGGIAENILVADALDRASLEAQAIQRSSFDVIISNPPIGITMSNLARFVDYELAYTQKGVQLRQRARIEELYIEQFLYLLKPEGRAGFIVPEAILASSRYRQLREWLFTHATVEAVISLPAGIWESTTIKTSILILSKQHTAAVKPIFMGMVSNVGVDRLGRAIEENDLPQIATYYRGFHSSQRTPDNDIAWSVPYSDMLVDRLDPAAWLPSYRRTIEQLRQIDTPTVRLREITETIFQGIRTKSSDTGISLISLSQMRDRELQRTQKRYIDQQTFERINQRQTLRIDDVLVTAVGQIGQAAVVREIDLPAVAGENIIVIRLRPNTITGDLLAVLFSVQVIQEQLRQVSIGAALPQLTVEALGSILIPIPDQDTQYRLVSQLKDAERMRDEANALEQDVIRQLSITFKDTDNAE